MKRRRILQVAALAILGAMAFALPWFVRIRPPTSKQMMQPDEREWSGVLSIGVVETWRPGASAFSAYARKIAQAFEKANPGVLVAITELEPYTLSQAFQKGHAPDVLLFGSGAVSEARENLMPLAGPFGNIREEYLLSGMVGEDVYAVPIAAGGYCVMANENILPQAAKEEGASWEEIFSALSQAGLTLQCPAPEAARLPAAGLLAATDGLAMTAGSALANNIGAVKRVMCWPDFVLEKKYACYVGTQYDIERMKMLISGGRDIKCRVLPSENAYTDMVQYVALSRPDRQMFGSGEEDGARLGAAASLLSMFLGESAREMLSSLKVMPVDGGEVLYDTVAGLDVLERSLMGDVTVPNTFSLTNLIISAGDGLAGAENFLRGQGWPKNYLKNEKKGVNYK